MTDWIALHPHWAALAVFLVSLGESLVVVGWFIPGTLVMFAVGALVAAGALDLWATILWAAAGAVAGDGISYWLGRHYRERRCSLPERRQGATGERRLEDLLGRQREEEDHPDVVDPEVERVGGVFVAGRVQVGPRHGQDGADEEQDGVVENEPDGASPGRHRHGVDPGPWRRAAASCALANDRRRSISPTSRRT